MNINPRHILSLLLWLAATGAVVLVGGRVLSRVAGKIPA
jgi:hypothetical protein